MNAEHAQHPLLGENADALLAGSDVNASLSAMVDGELDASELDALVNSLERDTLSSWHAYHVIGDVLRGHQDPTGAQPTSVFLMAVRQGLNGVETGRQDLPLAAMSSPAAASAQGRHEAANDAAFRWKLLAGFASLAAVMAVSWSVVSSPGSAGAEGAQLASGTPVMSAPAAATAAAQAAQAPQGSGSLAVNTGQGVLIRDAQLEALLAEHRQHGGMSALQMPSGFIRNATYEAAGR